ncbi:hypothetical protein GcM1_124001 [Golovinomyces cichoracearum]|uniref:Uncharacterized protein n=1 Tax=Golovinomyces cichoracearum TaxID=62708 RepID=A0A420JC20_9PEZI|nr:hypothetical protein GcM1_124001 [Golovinomyces cichoracearum]
MEAYTGIRPNIDHIRPWGYKAYGTPSKISANLDLIPSSESTSTSVTTFKSTPVTPTPAPITTPTPETTSSPVLKPTPSPISTPISTSIPPNASASTLDLDLNQEKIKEFITDSQDHDIGKKATPSENEENVQSLIKLDKPVKENVKDQTPKNIKSETRLTQTESLTNSDRPEAEPMDLDLTSAVMPRYFFRQRKRKPNNRDELTEDVMIKKIRLALLAKIQDNIKDEENMEHSFLVRHTLSSKSTTDLKLKKNIVQALLTVITEGENQTKYALPAKIINGILFKYLSQLMGARCQLNTSILKSYLYSFFLLL